MKKSIFFLAGIVGLSLASCEDTSDLGKPQINEKPVEVQANGVKATATANLTGKILNLGDFENKNIPVLDVTINSDFPENATVTGTFQVADNEGFTNAAELPITLEAVEAPGQAVTKADPARKYQAVVEGNLWEDAFVSYFGNAPVAKDNFYRYVLYIQIGTQLSELTGDYVDGRKINVMPVDQKLAVNSKYFISGSHIAETEMTHSDKHQYDDPLFSYVANVTEETVANFTWKVTGKGAPDNNVYGVADPAAKAGQLKLISEGGKPGQLSEEGAWKIEVNMLTKTYTISLAAETLYVFGPASANGFGPKALQIGTTDFVNYSGVGLIKDTFRLAAQKSANKGIVYGMGAAQGSLAVGGDPIAVEGAKAANLYFIEANVVALTYSVTAIEKIGLIGGFNDWNGDAFLKANAAKTVWSGEVTVAGATEWKFRANEDWDINWGGSLDNLTVGGDNLSFPEAGTYKVSIDFTKLPYTATVEKK